MGWRALHQAASPATDAAPVATPRPKIVCRRLIPSERCDADWPSGFWIVDILQSLLCGCAGGRNAPKRARQQQDKPGGEFQPCHDVIEEHRTGVARSTKCGARKVMHHPETEVVHKCQPAHEEPGPA